MSAILSGMMTAIMTPIMRCCVGRERREADQVHRHDQRARGHRLTPGERAPRSHVVRGPSTLAHSRRQ